MIGGIAGQGGFDPKKMSAQAYSTSTTSTSYVTLISITGSGLLTSVSSLNRDGGRLKITADGVALNELLSISSAFIGVFSATPFVKFSSSLLVQVRSEAGAVSSFTGTVLLD